MQNLHKKIGLFVLAATPMIVAVAQQPAPLAEQVFKDIKVFKGLPASEIIPTMQFMSASMKMECTGCHEPTDYAAPHKGKEDARKMVLLQKDINDRHFNGRLEVTCMTCHHGEEHPNGMPAPEGLSRRHQRITPAPKAQDIVDKWVKQSGTWGGAIVRTGTFTGMNEATKKVETHPLTLTQAPGGKFKVSAEAWVFGSDGAQGWYFTNPMVDEPAAYMARVGRAWVGDAEFKGLTRMMVSGKDKIGNTEVIVVQSGRPSTSSTEELYFDSKSGVLLRMVNFRRSAIGTVVSMIDYSGYKKIGTAMVPMKIVVSHPTGDQWTLTLKAGKVDASVTDDAFKMGSK